MIDKTVMQKIKQKAIQIDWDCAFVGKSRGNKHLQRTAKIAKWIAQKENADLAIVEAGAWLHDITLLTGDDENYQKNTQLTLDLLEPFGILGRDALRVAECVATHEGIISPETLEAKIVHDADVLEKIGILGLIRHTWKLTILGKIDPQDITDKNVKEVINHIRWRIRQLQTESGKKLAKSSTTLLIFDLAKKLIKQISSLAAKGQITEEIAEIILPNLNSQQQNNLKKQLTNKTLDT